MKKIAFIALALITSACASYHPGKVAPPVHTGPSQLPLKVSSKLLDAKKDDSNFLLEVTMENTSDKWMTVQAAQAEQDKNDVILGKNLVAWAESKTYRDEVNQYNKKMVQGTLMLAGAAVILAASKDNQGLRNMGLATAGTGLALSAADGIERDIDAAEQSKKVPEAHLFTETIVPAKMFMRRWILINKPSTSLKREFLMSVKNTEGASETYAINY